MGKYTRKTKRTKQIGCILLALALTSAAVGTAIARYVKEKHYEAEAVSAGFFVSSDYLETSGAAHTITDTNNTFDIAFYNYEKENTAKIAQMDVSYMVDLPEGWQCVVTKEDGSYVSHTNGIYTFRKSDSLEKHVLTITRDSGTKGTVAVRTTSPFSQTLSAEFTFAAQTLPSWQVTSYGTHCVLQIQTNDFAGSMNISWPASCAPDNTHPAMLGWVDTNTASLDVTAHTGYELTFFTTSAVSASGGTGTTVSLGG